MLLKKMARRFWILLFLVKFGDAFGLSKIGCPNEEFCKCPDNKVICVGNKATSTLNIGLFHPDNDPLLFKISGFHTVNLKFHLLQGLTLNTVIISNITNLIINTFAFLASGNLDHLEISDVSNLTASQFSLYHIKNIKKIIFRNVKSGYLLGDTVSITDTEYLNINNCEFGTISSNGIKTSNVTRVVVNNTLIKSIESDGIIIIGTAFTESLTFHNVSIENISTSALVVSSTPEVAITNCHLGTISQNFCFGVDIDTFNFVGNNVNDSDIKLFDNLNSTHLIVRNNTFFNVQRTSLDLYAIQEGRSFEKNSFNCSCDTWWLWNASEDVLQTNQCLLNSSSDFTVSVRIADLEPRWTRGNGSACSGLFVKEDQKSTEEDDKEDTNAKNPNENGQVTVSKSNKEGQKSTEEDDDKEDTNAKNANENGRVTVSKSNNNSMYMKSVDLLYIITFLTFFTV